MSDVLTLGDVTIEPRIDDGQLKSLGDVRINETPLRNTEVRFLPWFDTYEGEVFRRFELEGIEEEGDETVIRTTAVSDPDTLFQERRDSSGDICLKRRHWDAEPERAEFNIHLRPATETVDGTEFSGFTYWFDYRSDEVAIHRMVDRQTWELGGDTDDLSLVCRNLFDVPKIDLSDDAEFSSVGLEQSVGVLPGNFWARWSLMPAFDMQYGPEGVLLGWFDRVSLIRTVVESLADERWVRYVDMHYFEQDTAIRTNPKTILHSPGELDEVDAVNLWTRVHDRERERARAQFDMPPEEPPKLAFGNEIWRDYDFEEDYGPGVEVAAEFDLDQIFIGPVWESGETLDMVLQDLISDEDRENTVLSKLRRQNKCTGLDIEVGGAHGGVEGLSNLCDRAAEKGIEVMAWMAAHMTPRTALATDPAYGEAQMSLFATKESGRHPDTGYAEACWPLDLNNPAVYEKFHDGFLGMAEETGLSGYLWDSFSNLGWWQIDYREGTMRPQFDMVCEMYADLVDAGLYITVEAIVSFSSHSCVGLHGGNVYADDLMPYSYDSNFSLGYVAEDQDDDSKDQLQRMLKGEKPVDELFECFAHRRVPRFRRETLLEGRDEWDDASVTEMKRAIRTYKAVRDRMQKRTVLRDNRGVIWEDGTDAAVFYVFRDQPWDAEARDALSGEAVEDGKLRKNRVYVVPAADALATGQ